MNFMVNNGAVGRLKMVVMPAIKLVLVMEGQESEVERYNLAGYAIVLVSACEIDFAEGGAVVKAQVFMDEATTRERKFYVAGHVVAVAGE